MTDACGYFSTLLRGCSQALSVVSDIDPCIRPTPGPNRHRWPARSWWVGDAILTAITQGRTTRSGCATSGRRAICAGSMARQQRVSSLGWVPPAWCFLASDVPGAPGRAGLLDQLDCNPRFRKSPILRNMRSDSSTRIEWLLRSKSRNCEPGIRRWISPKNSGAQIPVLPCLVAWMDWRAQRPARSVRLNMTTGSRPTSTSASEGNAASPRRSSRAS